LPPAGVGYTSKQIAGSKLIGSPDRIKSISKKNRDKEDGACPRSRSAPIEADYRRMIGFGVESIPKKNRGKEGGSAPARGRLHIEAIQVRNVHLPRFINSFSFCSRAISCNLPRCAAIQRGKHTFQTCNLLHCTVDGEIAVARNQSRASADQRGKPTFPTSILLRYAPEPDGRNPTAPSGANSPSRLQSARQSQGKCLFRPKICSIKIARLGAVLAVDFFEKRFGTKPIGCDPELY
jgi:hypothetical protein